MIKQNSYQIYNFINNNTNNNNNMQNTRNSQHRTSQISNRMSNQEMSMNQTELQQLYEGSGLEFIPPQHKYIQCDKFQSAFFKDNNQEEYVIQRAFKGNNFTYLRNLPDNFSRNCILDDRKQRVKGQLNQESTKRNRTPLQAQQTLNQKINQIKKAKIGTLGYFQLFPYKESDYELPKKLAIKERKQNVQKRKQICDKQFRPAGFDVKMKYQDPFRYIDRLDATTSHCGTQKYLFPFHLPEDVYDSFKQSERRRKMVQQQLIIAGQFYPSKTEKSLNQVSKAKMPQILNEIQFYFKKFLKNNYGYFIGVNKRDHIEIMFESKYGDDPRLQMALSGMLQHQILSRFMLKRNFQRWGVVNANDYLEFIVLPPWVKEPEEKLRATTASTHSKVRTPN